MTDKQIIIDGVDVSGCGFYHSVTGTECHIALAFAEEYIDNDHTYLKCEQNPNCHYKQLKRKEQECEEKDKSIKFLLEKLDLSNNRRQDCEIHWEKERKELKQQLDQLKAENARGGKK